MAKKYVGTPPKGVRWQRECSLVDDSGALWDLWVRWEVEPTPSGMWINAKLVRHLPAVKANCFIGFNGVRRAHSDGARVLEIQHPKLYADALEVIRECWLIMTAGMEVEHV